MFVELHLLQNFPPSNLNRDDTGAPKDCEFGGYRRARISSQCLKRAIRCEFKKRNYLPKESLACRTKRLLDELVRRLGKAGRGEGEARAVAAAALRGAGLEVKEDNKTQYLLFLGEREIAELAHRMDAHWDTLLPLVGPGGDGAPPGEGEGKKGRRTAKDRKKEAAKAIPDEVRKALRDALDGGKAADLALFGRMLADLSDKNVDAACQVAHALSTNKVSMEMDYYTAVDDLKLDDTAGADMIGTVEFNSSCFYRYANINLGQLTHEKNLGRDDELARKTVEAFLRASVEAIPTGKQNSFAARSCPSLILAVVRERGLWSLANAFVQPVRPTAKKSLVAHSIEALDSYWGELTRVYGDEGLRYLGYCLCLPEKVDLPCLDRYARGGDRRGGAEPDSGRQADASPDGSRCFDSLVREVMAAVGERVAGADS